MAVVIRQIEMHDQIQIGSIQTKYCPCSHSILFLIQTMV